MACGARHTLVLAATGAAFAFGWNRFGQLGLGGGDRASRSLATRVPGPWEAHGGAPAASPLDACGQAAPERSSPDCTAGTAVTAARPTAGYANGKGGRACCDSGDGQDDATRVAARSEACRGSGGGEMRVLDVVAGWWHTLFVVAPA